ncbi:MAG: proline dehydrogenase family protein [Candidatus Acidiferrales bacterium]
MRERATRYRFVQRAVSRFMPGETAEDALACARELKQEAIGAVFTFLGENVSDASEAERVTEHYLDLLDHIGTLQLGSEVSVKLTQLGLDLDQEICHSNLVRIVERAGGGSTVWIDMESSPYVDRTLEVYRRIRKAYTNVGICLQAYLHRTAADVASLIPLGACIRLVKGAYKEPPSVAFPKKDQVDENFFKLTCQLLKDEAASAGVRAAIATHDLELIGRIIEYAQSKELGKERFEFQMLYGIQRQEQLRLAREGWKSIVLVAYGSYWFPWYMRRLAERPANVLFVLRNLWA